jgi:Repeat of unknown function (DUF6923)
MTCRGFCSVRGLAAAGIAVAALALAGAPASAQPFECSGRAYVIQGNVALAQLTVIDQTVSPFVFTNVGGTDANNINNIGFNKSNGLIYGYRRSGTVEIVSMDQTGASGLTGLGNGGLPAAASVQYNSGDVSPNGSLMYFNSGGTGAFHTINLPALTLNNSCTVNGVTTGQVADWAAHPTNGFLYGADDGDGQLARIDPTTCLRTDFTLTPALPTGSGFGAAWFDGSGHLYVYRNSPGAIYEVDIGALTSTSINTGPTSSFNDGAACIQDLLGVAKGMSSGSGNALPSTITVTYTFENFSGSNTATSMTAMDDLAAVFGTHGVDWTFSSISSSPTGTFANPAFNGHTVFELINQAPTQSLGPGAVETVTVTFTLMTHNAAVMDEYINSVTGKGSFGGLVYSDISQSGADPDPDMDGSPTDNRVPTVLTVPVELTKFSID